MHTLLSHSAPKLLPINIKPDWAQVQSWLGGPPAAAFVADGANPAPTLQRGPSPNGDGPPSMYGQRLKTKRAPDRADGVLQGFALGPFRISLMIHWLPPGQANGLAS
jgi:hypothetical protein